MFLWVRGISGYVATTVAPLNIPDAYKDDRSVDRTPRTTQKTGYRTRSILCMPVLEPKTDNIVAVVQLAQQAQRHALNEQDGAKLKEFAEFPGGVILRELQFLYVARSQPEGSVCPAQGHLPWSRVLDLEKTSCNR